MKLYCSQLAWLHASFDNGNKSRSAKVARLFSIQSNGEQPEMPPIGCAQYIIGYMHKIGFPMASEGYVKHSEIKIWCESQGIELLPDEHQMIFDSFIQYNSKKASYEASPHEPAPYTSKSVVEVEQDKQANLSSFMQGMIKK